MTRVCDIEKMLYDWAPRDLALEWDNVGLLVGDSGAEVRKVLVSLDVTEAVAAEAVAIGADLIVAHHPLMNCAWHKVQHVTTDDTQGRTITTLLKNNVSAICMHTNLDAAEGGVNDDCGRPVRRVAVGGGACGDYIGQAIALGCDTFVTSDLSYHEFLDTKALNLIDAGHFPTENVICPVIAERLQAAFPHISVALSAAHDREIIQYCIKKEK